ncbi:hypothetical protein FGO68_gene8059 [Halteria grandinella]|uniref:Thioredoxin domain-containing protein n=1 Tax=Halteria grandinella TaxID=5974 RepID=A0A8J8NGH8_HALGN|nr:hypothetical protein FGO68_gene8059 [Halteria grandinella]
MEGQGVMNGQCFQGKRIKIARVDLYNRMNPSFKELEAWRSVPKMFVYKKGEYYPYDGYFMRGMFLAFINRVLNPVVTLKNSADVDRFLDASIEFEEHTEFYKNKFEGIGDYYGRMSRHVRVIGFFNDKSEYKNEYRQLLEAAQKLAGKRDDLRVAVVTSSSLVYDYKKKFGPKWFDEHSRNTIVLQREKDTNAYYDLEKDDQDLHYWINKMSLKKTGDELTREVSIIGQSINQPSVYLYLDRNHPYFGADSKLALDAFQRVAPFWFEQFTFFWAEEGKTASDFLDKRRNQGIYWSKLPALTIVTPGGNYFPIAMDAQISETLIGEHLLNYTKGILKSAAIDQDAEEKFKRRDMELLDKFGNTRALTRHNFKDNAVSSQLDVVVFVHTSEKNHHDWKKGSNWAYDFDTASLTLRTLKFKSVLLVTYDIFVEGMISDIDDMTVPSIYLYPSNSTNPQDKIAFKHKGDNLSAIELMKFIERNAGKKITLPENLKELISDPEKAKKKGEKYRMKVDRKKKDEL